MSSFIWPDQNKLNFVFFHLEMFIDISDGIRQRFKIGGNTHNLKSGDIFFPVSENDFNIKNVKWLDDIPVLFPTEQTRSHYSFSNGILRFHHDILKSVFYLLSGYQEYHAEKSDHFYRFPYEASIQAGLNIAHKPVVNYFFEIIMEALKIYAKYHGYGLQRRKPFWKNMGFLLSHDVDVLDYFTFSRLKYQLKQSIKKPSVTQIRQAFDTARQLLKGKTKLNPAWDFERLLALEQELGFSSVFYFLDKDLKNQDADFELTSKRVQLLMQWLANQGKEIGLHGTCRSSTDPVQMQRIYERIHEVAPNPVKGIRQHRLMYRSPETLDIQEQIGLEYDTTMGFAGHEGFRHSFCHPFRPFNHRKNRMSSLWEFPLNVMDGTLFYYRRYSFAEANKSVERLLEEITRFNGLFTLLWHNGFNNPYENPGALSFYQELLLCVAERQATSLTGLQVLEQMKQQNAG
jgi:hypothetical protein